MRTLALTLAILVAGIVVRANEKPQLPPIDEVAGAKLDHKRYMMCTLKRCYIYVALPTEDDDAAFQKAYHGLGR